MPNIITAGNSTNGGTSVTTDTSGTLNIVTGSGAGATAVTVDGSQNVAVNGNMSFNSGYGSAAVAYGCRAWVNFDGTGTVAIRASGNVSSITDNGAGDYTVNFTTAMPDINYSAVANSSAVYANYFSGGANINTGTVNATEFAPTTTAIRMQLYYLTGGVLDAKYVNVAVFR